jgi:hypothetical protein
MQHAEDKLDGKRRRSMMEAMHLSDKKADAGKGGSDAFRK